MRRRCSSSRAARLYVRRWANAPLDAVCATPEAKPDGASRPRARTSGTSGSGRDMAILNEELLRPPQHFSGCSGGLVFRFIAFQVIRVIAVRAARSHVVHDGAQQADREVVQ